MSAKKNTKEKLNLHPRNRNRLPYDLKAMAVATPELLSFIQPNKSGADSINFSDPTSVKWLNKAILKHYYDIPFWEFPDEHLCPPIPGRADYIHYVADLLSESNGGKIPKGERVTCLDIGVGASCIYPILGVTEHQWNFIGTDINANSIEAAQRIVESNPSLKGKVICKKQNDPKYLFRGMISKGEKIDISICNPPFHSSKEEAKKGTSRKVKNLTGQKTTAPKSNFSGVSNELIYEGGEVQFISNMITESKALATSVFWFSTLVSKETNLKRIYKLLEKNNPSEVKTIPIKTGNKKGRILAWTYLSRKQREVWREIKWK